MDKDELKRLLRWIESEDYQDFADNFDTLDRRVEYIHKTYFETKEQAHLPDRPINSERE